MSEIKNMGIESILMMPKFRVICPISQSPMTLEMKVSFSPKNEKPNYMELHNWIRHNLESKRLSIEEASKTLGDYLVKAFEPLKVVISASSKDVAVHFPVEVTMVFDNSSYNEQPQEATVELPARKGKGKSTAVEPEHIEDKEVPDSDKTEEESA